MLFKKYGIVFLTCVMVMTWSFIAFSAEQKVIGVTLMTREHVFFNLLEEAMQKRADELGYKLVIMDANFDLNKQLGQIDDFIVQKVDAVIISPAATGGLEPAIKKLASVKIPVVTNNIKINSTDPIIISQVGTDNYGGGALAGEYAAEKVLNKKGKVAVITFAEIQETLDRDRGFKDTIAKYPDITVLDTQNYAGSAEKAQQLTQDMLVKFPEIDLIYTVGDPAVVGGLAAVKTAGRTVKFIGFDGNPEAIEAIKAGGMWIADVSQHPDQMGKFTIDALNAYWSGQSYPSIIKIPTSIIDKDNLEKK
ncbi:MAG: substrate-binding domain-containing protein [Candidatus Atribacteria bacterium]|nr:substrate-binding domain-containing protein [Candidatus Atribacteria bacterium]